MAPTLQDHNQSQHNPFDEAMLRGWFQLNNDVILFKHLFGASAEPVTGLFIYCSGMVETYQINEVILPELKAVYEQTGFHSCKEINREADLQWDSIDFERDKPDRIKLASYVYEGHLLFCLPNVQAMWTIDIANLPSRPPDQSSTEVSIRGPKDGFTEQLSSNVALIRKRLRTNTLACEYYVLGTRTLTKTALLYISDIANVETIDQIRSKLSSIDVESIISTGNLEDLLSPSKVTLFPPTHYTGRPDFTVECLLNGRFIILVDGNPTAIIAPINLFLLMKSPEDAYFPFLSANIGRLLRFFGLLTTIFLPGFYIALTTFHSDQVPFPLLATIAMGRHGLPMETGLEMFFIMILMELFREAGVRLPSSIGQTLTVVGGLIIGDAAIRAGLVSPMMIVITAITVVSGSTLVNQSLTSTTILLRFFSFLMGAILGMYGFILSVIAFVLYLSNIQSFGVPYLAPAAPLKIREFASALFRLPFLWRKKRPDYLNTSSPEKRGNHP
ncbi:spore germination protein [Paenibacillus sp. 1011MAR3C5]|uniref:spore germination protein n=1 Tax=Paenibacillus sp. 1011MAR3C5 TaxID=1675787 RepID=UPI000E6CD654|nr:spore germination protein [Paenibacillus sp. 1011MAR3C5]RJE88696.1 spore germination protein [Paenibacillus sp. 1011MAR3C5]